MSHSMKLPSTGEAWFFAHTAAGMPSTVSFKGPSSALSFPRGFCWTTPLQRGQLFLTRFLLLSCSASYREALDFQRRLPDPDRNTLPLLAAGADAAIELEIAADHGHACERIGAVADQRRALDRMSHLAVLDEVGFGGRKYEFAIRDVDLPAAEVGGIEPLLHAGDDLLRIVRSGEHVGVRHARQREMGEGLAAPVAGDRHLHEARVQAVLQVGAQH